MCCTLRYSIHFVEVRGPFFHRLQAAGHVPSERTYAGLPTRKAIQPLEVENTDTTSDVYEHVQSSRTSEWKKGVGFEVGLQNKN